MISKSIKIRGIYVNHVENWELLFCLTFLHRNEYICVYFLLFGPSFLEYESIPYSPSMLVGEEVEQKGHLSQKNGTSRMKCQLSLAFSQSKSCSFFHEWISSLQDKWRMFFSYLILWSWTFQIFAPYTLFTFLFYLFISVSKPIHHQHQSSHQSWGQTFTLSYFNCLLFPGLVSWSNGDWLEDRSIDLTWNDQ